MTRNEFEYLSPRPGAIYLLPQSTIILRPGETFQQRPLNLADRISVSGSVSGDHSGKIRIAGDRKSVLFKPDSSFLLGEHVTVSISAGFRSADGRPLNPLIYRFRIANTLPAKTSNKQLLQEELKDVLPEKPAPTTSTPEKYDPHAAFSLPPDFPIMNITAHDNPSDSYYFLANLSWGPNPPRPYHLLMLDNNGFPVFFRKLPFIAVDFKPQANGYLTYFDIERDVHYALDQTFTLVDSFTCGNGYLTDLHELQVLENHHALLMSYDPQIVDLREYGGREDATVIGLVIQEQDANKDVIFQWRSWDHMEITDSDRNLTSQTVDLIHGNSIEVDDDDHLLISSRNLKEVTKINRITGNIIWRLGGLRNEFTFVDEETSFNHQHDARRLSNGNILIYDNSNQSSPRESRAVEYHLDEVNKIATKVWEYREPGQEFGDIMGSSRRLANGNTVIGWGRATRAVSEIRPDGVKALEMRFEPALLSYRAIPSTWKGRAKAPYIWKRQAGPAATLSFMHFGAENIREYHIYRGTSAEDLNKIATTAEQFLRIRSHRTGITEYYGVKSIDNNGIASEMSNVIAYTPTYSKKDSETPMAGTEEDIQLLQNYPNPFNPSTSIRFTIAEDNEIELLIFNILGQQVRQIFHGHLMSGDYNFEWDGNNSFGNPLPSGVYYYQLTSGQYRQIRKMLLIR